MCSSHNTEVAIAERRRGGSSESRCRMSRGHVGRALPSSPTHDPKHGQAAQQVSHKVTTLHQRISVHACARIQLRKKVLPNPLRPVSGSAVWTSRYDEHVHPLRPRPGKTYHSHGTIEYQNHRVRILAVASCRDWVKQHCHDRAWRVNLTFCAMIHP